MSRSFKEALQIPDLNTPSVSIFRQVLVTSSPARLVLLSLRLEVAIAEQSCPCQLVPSHSQFFTSFTIFHLMNLTCMWRLEGAVEKLDCVHSEQMP
jgi:hypothetical protein